MDMTTVSNDDDDGGGDESEVCEISSMRHLCFGGRLVRVCNHLRTGLDGRWRRVLGYSCVPRHGDRAENRIMRKKLRRTF